MKECDSRKCHISRKLNMIYISSNNVGRPVSKTFTTLHPTTLHFLSVKLHPTTLHYPLIYNCLPEDDPKRFETYRRQQKLNIKY
jgi:hypothetical protein